MDNSLLLIGGLLLGAAIALIVYTILSQLNEKAVVRSSLRQLDGYEVENVRDQELLVPFSQRALVPVVGGLTSIGRRFTPTGYVDNIRRKFIFAGNGSADAVDRFLAVRVITIALIPLVWIGVYWWNPVNLEGFIQFLVAVLLSVALALGPDAILS